MPATYQLDYGLLANNLMPNPSLETGLGSWAAAGPNYTNGVRNPSAETNTNDWACGASGVGQTIARNATDAWQGSACFEGAITALTAGGFLEMFVGDSGAPSAALQVVPGDIVFVSMAIKLQAGTSNTGSLQLSVRATNAGSFVSQTVVTSVTNPTIGQWQILSGWYTVPAGVTAAAPRAAWFNSVTGDYTMRVDAAMTVKAPDVSTAYNYIDGSQPGCGWSGTAHASQSSFTAGVVNLIRNPSFTVDAFTGWGPIGNSTNITGTVQAVSGAFGGNACRVTADAATAANQTAGRLSEIMKVIPGMKLNAQMQLQNNGTANDVRLRMRWYAPDGTTQVGGATWPETILTTKNAWARVELTATVPADAGYCRVEGYALSSAAAQTFNFALDAVQLTVGPTQHDYFDGTLYGGVWFGTAHASESVVQRIVRSTDGVQGAVTWAGKVGTSAAHSAARVVRNTGSSPNWAGTVYNQYLPIVGGAPYTFMCNTRVRRIFPSGGTSQARMEYWWYTGTTFISGGTVGQTNVVGDFVWNATVTAPAAADAVRIVVDFFLGSGINDGIFDMWFDAVGIMDAAGTGYFDGDTWRAFWTGTAHASSSVLYDDTYLEFIPSSEGGITVTYDIDQLGGHSTTVTVPDSYKDDFEEAFVYPGGGLTKLS